MNDASPPKKTRWYRRFLPSTTEGKVAFVSALLLILIVIGTWIARWLGRENVNFGNAMTMARMVAELGLAILASIALYFGLRWWNQAEEEVFPDIDRTWKAGVNALHTAGLSLQDLPIFVILGSPNPTVENQFMAAGVSELRIRGVPEETTVRHALRWFASNQAIYLFCSDTCALSDLANDWQHRPPTGELESAVVRDFDESPETPVPAETDEAGTFDEAGTMDFGEFAAQKAGDARPQPPPARLAAASPEPALSQPAVAQSSELDSMRGDLDGTMMADEIRKKPTPPQSRVAAAGTTSRPKPRPLPSTEVVAPSRPANLDWNVGRLRLQYVCQLLQHARRPRCGINGLLALLPFELSQAGSRELAQLASAARQDIEVIQETLGLRAPVTAMVIGLERQKGFSEFIGRLDYGARFRRVGGSFELRCRPSAEELNNHSDRICDDFEEWVYRLYGQPDALTRHRGNRKLYWLLSRIRHELKPRLRLVLGDAYGLDAHRADLAHDQSFLFSGCYFAAVGSTSDQSAFVKGVVEEKLLRERAQIEWNRDALRRNTLMQWATRVGWIAFFILLAIVVLQFVR